MRTNADITIYNRYTHTDRTHKYQRTQIADVAWESRKAANILASGGNIAVNAARVFIPFAGHDTDYLLQKDWQELVTKTGKWTLQEGDVIVKGLVSDEITTGFTVTDLKKKYDNVFEISSVDTMDAGSYSMQHWNVGCK